MNDEQWFREHAAYLATPQWAERRRAVLARDKRQCRAGLEVCTGDATQVHHLTYRHWRCEPLFDLVSVCTPCHESITRLERGENAERMLVAYRGSAEHQKSTRIAELERQLAAHDPEQLSDQQLGAYCRLERLLAGLQGLEVFDMSGHRTMRSRNPLWQRHVQRTGGPA